MGVFDRVGAVARGIGGLRGWRRWTLALALGTGAGFSMPPWHVFPLMPVGLVGLLWLLAGAAASGAARPGRRGMIDGTLWGTGYFTVGSLWILEAFQVPPADFAAFGPPIVGGLAVLLALFVGFAGSSWAWLAARRPAIGMGWRGPVAFGAASAGFEWLRGHVFTGYPWNPASHVWMFADALAQPAAWVGSYGLSALTVALLGLPAALTAVPRIGLGLAALALAAPFAAGALRLAPSTQASPAVSLRLVQPNVPQGEKWRRELRDRHFEQLMRLSTLERPAATKVVIWPETATPFVFAESPDYRRMAARIVPPGGYLLLGAPRGAMTPGEAAIAPPGGQRPIWNSLHAVDGGGAILATYDKIHLVPLGEYLPLRRWFPILADTIGRGSFEAGAERRTIRLPGLPAMAVVICYEVIFPGAVVDGADRPGWILNVTNDSWFGESSGPHQHLVSARMRSIEEGLPQIRVANTGISAVIDPYGRIEARLGMNKTGVIDHELPAALPPTFYARWSDWTFLALLVGMLGIAGWGAGPRRR